MGTMRPLVFLLSILAAAAQQPGHYQLKATPKTVVWGHYAANTPPALRIKSGDTIEIPLRPFFGSMGVAPPEASGRISSAPPWIHAGNLDNKEFVAGTTLFIPVHAPGALFQAGDGHAGQGNGEVDITALETSLTGTFQFIVRKDMHLRWPRAETPTHYIVMGLHEDLTEAAQLAVREAIDFLMTENPLTRDAAHMLPSVPFAFSTPALAAHPQDC